MPKELSLHKQDLEGNRHECQLVTLFSCARAVLGYSSCCLERSNYEFSQFHIASSSALPADESTAFSKNVIP